MFYNRYNSLINKRSLFLLGLPIKSIVIKRTMFKTVFQRTLALPSSTQAQTLKENVCYVVRRTTPQTTSHEHAQVNPILPIGGKAKQHPTISNMLCKKNHCENTLCSKPCDQGVNSTDVAHVEHARYVSATDLSKTLRPQWGIFYETPVPNTDTTGSTRDFDKTEELNKNSEALVNVHMYAKNLKSTSNHDS